VPERNHATLGEIPPTGGSGQGAPAGRAPENMIVFQPVSSDKSDRGQSR